MKKTLIISLLLMMSCSLIPDKALAQHSSEVQKLTSERDYFNALKLYQTMPSRKITADTMVAAAKSAWALSLPQKAIDEFERALREKSLDDVQRARLLISRGIIEYQEGRYRVAILFAEKVIGLLKEASPLRSKAWLLWAESLYRLKSYGAAEAKYRKALKESDTEELPNIYFALGNAQMQLGKLDDAKKSFEHIPLHHVNAPAAIRHLAEISLQEKKFKQASFWLKRGRHDFPDYFIDSWTDYALTRVALNQGKKEKAMKIQEEASNKYPPSDEWLTMLNAAIEEYMWNEQFEGIKQ